MDGPSLRHSAYVWGSGNRDLIKSLTPRSLFAWLLQPSVLPPSLVLLRPAMLALSLLLSLLGTAANAAVTVYTDIPGVNAPLTTSTAPFAQSTENSAYSSLVLQAPNPPGGLQRDVPIILSTTPPAGISINQKGSFLGFSVELSIADAIRMCWPAQRIPLMLLMFRPSPPRSRLQLDGAEPPVTQLSRQPQRARRPRANNPRGR